MRGGAAESLGKIRAESAIPLLVELLEDSDFSVGWKATHALGEIGAESTISALVKLLKDENELVCISQ